MPLQLSQTSAPADLRPLSELTWDAFMTPKIQLFHMMCLPQGRGEAARQREIDYVESAWFAPTFGTSAGRWWKVVDTETGTLAGAGNIVVHESQKPYGGAAPPKAVWWPEGEKREFASQVVAGVHAFRITNMDRPHVYFQALVVREEYRRRGVGTMIVEEILKFADAKGLDIWVDASPMAVDIYRRHGCIMIEEFDIVPHKENPGAEWRQMQQEYPLPEHRMGLWRPAGGVRKEGQPLPWEEGGKGQEEAVATTTTAA